jgi:hypothetical protein
MERALRQELRAADLLGLRLEYVDEQRADRLALFSGSSCRRARCSSTATTLESTPPEGP